jgi:hypothetical protein
VTPVRLDRFLRCTHGNFGIMSRNTFSSFTMEDDWDGNKPKVSCIPAGTYELHRKFSERFKCELFEVVGVPGRSAIEIHPGNTEENVEGCITPGVGLGVLDVQDEDNPAHPLVKKLAVTSSKVAFSLFMASMKGIDRCPFIVTDPKA